MAVRVSSVGRVARPQKLGCITRILRAKPPGQACVIALASYECTMSERRRRAPEKLISCGDIIPMSTLILLLACSACALMSFAAKTPSASVSETTETSRPTSEREPTSTSQATSGNASGLSALLTPMWAPTRPEVVELWSGCLLVEAFDAPPLAHVGIMRSNQEGTARGRSPITITKIA